MRVFAAIFLLGVVAQASAQTPSTTPTSFTYQGELLSAGAPASGLHDIRFRLYDAAGSATQLGPTVCRDNVNITDGKFTATLDFGSQFAGSQSRLLELEVRRDTGLGCDNLAGFTVLAPQLQITSAPRAISAITAMTAASATVATALVRPDGTGTGVVNVTNAGNVGIGTSLPGGKLDIASGGGSYFRIDNPNGDLRVNGGTDGFFGIFNEGVAAGSTSFNSVAGTNLTINNGNGNVGIGAAPDASRKLFVNGQIGLSPTFRVKSIHGASFLPDTVSRDSGSFGYYDELGVRGYGASTASFIAPVELPDGCQVQRIDLTYSDSRPVDFTLAFGRTSTTTGVVSTIASVSTTGQSAAIRVAGVDLAGFGIGNNSNVYWLRANLQSFGPELHQIVAVRITYTVTSPLP